MAGNQDKVAFKLNKITVYVYKTNITKLDVTVDAIVNSANSGLKHIGGVSKVIATAAGPSLDSECREIIKSKKYLKITDVVKTTAGNIRSCKFVIHAVGPNPSIQNCNKLLRRTFRNVLNFADTNQCSRIAMHPICSGKKGMSNKDVAEAMCKAIESFAQTNSNNTLRKIYVVDIKDGVIHHVIDKLKKRGFVKVQTKSSVSSTRKRPHEADKISSSKSARRSGLMEGQKKTFVVGGANVIVYKCEIKNLRVNAIVNSIYSEHDFSSGLVAAIRRAAGSQMIEELQEAAETMSITEAVATTGGRFCLYVIHAKMPKKPRTSDSETKKRIYEQFQETLMNVLVLAEACKTKTLAFPPIGSGFGGFSADYVANSLVNAITKFASSKGFNYLREIHVVDNKRDVLNRVIYHMDRNK